MTAPTPPRPPWPKDPKPRSWLSRQWLLRVWWPLRRSWVWIMRHWGWGWHGHSVDKVHTNRVNPGRRQISAYCREYGLTRKAVKKQQKAIKRYHYRRKQLRAALADARKAGRAPDIAGIIVTSGARSVQRGQRG